MPEQTHFQEAATRLLESGEHLITIAEAAGKLPRVRGAKTSPATITRWIIIGKGGIRLDGVRLTGKTWWTSMAAIARFAAQMSERATVAVQVPPPPRQRRAAEEAGERIDAILNRRKRQKV